MEEIDNKIETIIEVRQEEEDQIEVRVISAQPEVILIPLEEIKQDKTLTSLKETIQMESTNLQIIQQEETITPIEEI